MTRLERLTHGASSSMCPCSDAEQEIHVLGREEGWKRCTFVFFMSNFLPFSSFVFDKNIKRKKKQKHEGEKTKKIIQKDFTFQILVINQKSSRRRSSKRKKAYTENEKKKRKTCEIKKQKHLKLETYKKIRNTNDRYDKLLFGFW